jgi:hypothetical protein
MDKDFEEIVGGCREMVDRGLTIGDLVEYLHRRGTTITDSMRTLMAVYGIPLRDAKAVVSTHPVWKDIVAAAEPLHVEAEQELNKQKEE